MIRLIIFTTSILFALIPAHSQWENVGNPDGFSTYNLVDGVIKHQPGTDVPYVFYKNLTVNVGSAISMQKFNGTEWEYVGEEVIDNVFTSNHHLDFDFDPVNNNSPIIYYHNGQNGPSTVAKLSGTTWEPLLGLSNFLFSPLLDVFPSQPLTFGDYYGFDVNSLGNPVIGFSDQSCTNVGFGNFPGNMSAIIHDGEEWQYLGQPCISARNSGNIDLEYSPITNELFGYHKGGEEISKFNQFRVLERLNGTQWDSIASPTFDLPGTVGHMRVNPVTGNVFLFDWGYEGGLGTDRQFKVYEWDGNELDSLHENGDLQIQQNDWLVDFHPITGEIHILFSEGNIANIKKHNGSGWVNTPFSDISELQLQSLEYQDMSFNSSGELYLLMGIDGTAKATVIKHDGTGGTVSVPLTAEDIKLNLFPNPAENELNVSFKSLQQMDISIINSLGQKIYMKRSVTGDLLIDTSALPSGVYSVLLDSADNVITKSLVIE